MNLMKSNLQEIKVQDRRGGKKAEAIIDGIYKSTKKLERKEWKRKYRYEGRRVVGTY